MRDLAHWAALLAVTGLASATPLARAVRRSPSPPLENGKYVVERRQAEFAKYASYDFSSASSLPSGLSASDYSVGGSPYTHAFTPSNAVVGGGYLTLDVPGGQTSSPIQCGEVSTDVNNILYASVRTVAILSDPAGVCNGNFFYKDDNQESDIEWLSDPNSTSNQGTRYLWFTDQSVTPGGASTHTNVVPPSDATSAEHEYRIDWTEGQVAFFVDGVQQWQTTENVPSTPGSWIWNNWSNGDPGWSVGPPQEDAPFRIRSIEMYYNTA